MMAAKTRTFSINAGFLQVKGSINLHDIAMFLCLDHHRSVLS